MSILAAYLIDRFFGELPNKLHPVAWMGSLLHLFRAKALSLPPHAAFIAGMMFWLTAVLVIVSIAVVLTHLCAQLEWPLQILITAVLIKPFFAVRMLVNETKAVENALMHSLTRGRKRLSHIVSRDTKRLSRVKVREAAMGSLSENFSDSVIAPLFWFALLGLPGIMLYRFANTADAMLGYRDEREWLGKWAARADDVLNFIPARISAALIYLIFRCRFSLHALIREAGKTPSPNGGYPMSAFALGLSIRLRKTGVYDLNPRGASPAHDDVLRGTAVIERASRIAFLCTAVVTFAVRHV